jgi:hypothetical protein
MRQMLSVHIVRQLLWHDVGGFRVLGSRSFHLYKWMFPTCRLNNLTYKLVPSLSQLSCSMLAHLSVRIALFSSPHPHRHCRVALPPFSDQNNMPPIVASFVKPFLPSSAQIALALTILRAKPAGIRVRGMNTTGTCISMADTDHQTTSYDYVLK